MKTIKFNEKEYQVPESWQDVTVGMLIKSAELSELLDDAPIIAIISAYTSIPVKELKLSQSEAVLEIVSTMSFISDEYVPTPRTEFEFQGELYSCEPDLTDQRFEDFVSIQTTLYNYREEPYRALPKLIAIYCKKDSETLDDFKLDERSKLMEGLSMTIAKDIEAFFLHSIQAYKAVSLLSSTQEIQKDLVLHKLQELRSTVKAYRGRTGLSLLTKLQIGLIRIYLWFLQRDLVKYFNSQPTEH